MVTTWALRGRGRQAERYGFPSTTIDHDTERVAGDGGLTA